MIFDNVLTFFEDVGCKKDNENIQQLISRLLNWLRCIVPQAKTVNKNDDDTKE